MTEPEQGAAPDKTSAKIDRQAMGFDVIEEVVKATQAAIDHPNGRHVMISLTIAMVDIVKLLRDQERDPGHALMVASIIASVAQPDGMHAIKAAGALGL